MWTNEAGINSTGADIKNVDNDAHFEANIILGIFNVNQVGRESVCVCVCVLSREGGLERVATSKPGK